MSLERTVPQAEETAAVPVAPIAAAAASAAPVPSGAASDRVPILAPLRVRDFGLVFSGETISMVGDQFHFIALAWLALQLTGSGLALGTVLMTAAIPRAVFMLVGGAFSDRLSPRSLMLYSNAIRAVVVAVLATLVITNHAQLWQLYILAAIFGVVDAFFWPAINTILPMLVPERQLAASNALLQGSGQLTGLIGPALAGVVVAAVQTGPAFAIDAASFAVAAGALILVRGGRRSGPRAEAGAAERHLLETIGEGIAFAWRDPAIRSLIVLVAAFNFAFTGPISVGIAWMAREVWGGSAAFGILFSAFGAGALVGAVAAGSLHRVRHLGWITLGLAGIAGIELAALGVAPSAPVAFAILLVMGLGIGFINVRVIAWLQGRVPEAMRGRVMSLLSLGSVSLSPFSLAVAGAVVDVAPAAMFAVAGVIVLGAAMTGIAWGVPALVREGEQTRGQS